MDSHQASLGSWFRSSLLWPTALPLALGLALYAGVLSLSFFGEDTTLLRWVNDQSPASILVSLYDGRYRPLMLELWKILTLPDGVPQPHFLHALNWVIHGLNILLVGWLAISLSGHRLYAGLVALFFATYPFHYQALGQANSQLHLFLNLFLLSAVIAADRYRRTSRPSYAWISPAAFGLALLTHEAALTLPVLLMIHATGVPEGYPRSRRFWVPYLMVALAWAGLSLGVMALDSSGRGLRLEGLDPQSVPLFGQAALLPLLLYVPQADNIAVGTAILTLASLASALFVRQLRLWWLGWGWAIITWLPSFIFLQAGYLYEAPRLFYVPAVGFALIWALVPVALWEAVRRGMLWMRSAVGLGLLALLLAGVAASYQYVGCRLQDYRALGRLIGDLRGVAEHTTPGQTLILVNLPWRLQVPLSGDPGCGNALPFGVNEENLIWPPQANLSDLILYNGGPSRSTRPVTLRHALGPYWNHALGPQISKEELRRQVAADEVLAFSTPPPQLIDLSSHWETHPSPLAPRAVFGNQLALLEYSAQERERNLYVTLRWRALSPIERYYTVFTHLLDSQGHLVAQHDAMPVNNQVPTVFLSTGDEVLDVHSIPLSAELPPGHYRLWAGVYDSQTLERLPLSGDQTGDAFLIGELELN